MHPAKAWLCGALTATGLDAWLARAAGSAQRPWVIGYHAVVEGAAAMGGLMPGLAITAGMLERHLDWIGRRFDFAALDDLLPGARPAGARPLAAITFDDGYRGVFDHAWPILRRKGIPAALFVVTDRIDGATPLLHDQLFRHLLAHHDVPGAYALTRSLLHSRSQAELLRFIAHLADAPPSDDELPLSWQMLRALRAGGCTIGSHTRSHALLTRTAGAELDAELRVSRSTLALGLGEPVLHFAYPDGAFDPCAVEAVESAGYQAAYTTCAHRDPRHPSLTRPRTMLWEGSSTDRQGRFCGPILDCQSSGLLDRYSGCGAAHAYSATA